jgi:hypothetical protein
MESIFLAIGAAAGLVAFMRDRRQVKALEDKILEIRAALAAAFPYRLPKRDDFELTWLLQQNIGPRAALLLERGMTVLGELVMQVPGHPPMAVMRAFTDESGAIAYLTIYPPQIEPSLLFETYTTDAEYITHVGNPVRASAPFSHQQTLPITLSIQELLDRHRAFARSGNELPITNIYELLRELERNHAMIMRWRDSLSPEDLLELDLRTLLGEQYELHGARWKRRLAMRMPKATLRRKR